MKSNFRLFAAAIFMAASQLACVSTPPANPVIIEWYGDSTTKGVTFSDNKYSELQNNEPSNTQELLNKKFGEGSILIENRGVNGTTAKQLIDGTHSFKTSFSQQLNAGKADIVIINFGINDCYTPGYTPEKYANDISELVRIARAAGKTVIIETPNPIDNMHNEWLWSFQHQAVVTGQKLGVPVINQWEEMMKRPDWQSLLGDKIHPTSPGYVVKSNISFAVIYPVVKSISKK